MTSDIRSLAVLGAQWGDEGKGKVVDYLASRAQVVARFQGGNNAGHTVVIGEQTYKMHHLPVGILYPGVWCLLGNGMVINPEVLVEELTSLEERGIDTSNLRISERAHVILPFHRALDKGEETFRGKNKIGTTGLGIGPAYADRAYRRGLRMVDFIDREVFHSWLEENLPLQNAVLQKIHGHPGFSLSEIRDRYQPLVDRLAPLVTDTSLLMQQHLDQGNKVLFEGSQGTLLDLEHGSYPYVTSSTTTTGGVISGLGIGPRMIREVLGVIKAYTTRVGEGPFPTEDLGEKGNYMREKGGEFGTTTGRPRRCGWFDGVIARYSARINGFTGWAVTKLDVLSGFEKLKMATSYYHKQGLQEEFPSQLKMLQGCFPKYQELDGWEEDITGARKIEQLPPEARRYLEAIEDLTGVKVVLVSTGPEREQTALSRGEII